MKQMILGGIFGHCVADALGVPVEFCSRGSLAQDPVVDMRGYGSYNQPAGTWSDDTSMTLCLLDSLTHGLDCGDIMEKFFLWLEEARYTPYGEVFDVGKTCRESVSRYLAGTPPLLCGGTSELENGNGSLMRILPLAFYLYARFGADFFDREEAVRAIHDVSALTHAHPRSKIACGIYVSIAGMLIGGEELRQAIRRGVDRAWAYYSQSAGFAEELKHYARLRSPDFADTPEREIGSSGYVVDTLEAALWCLLNTDSYPACVLKAVNLGEDTDTTGAVAGGLAGLYYGFEAIPTQWLKTLAKSGYIADLCAAFSRSLTCAPTEK